VTEIKYCKQILDEDYEVMSQIVLPSTLKRISQLKQSYMEKYLRYYIQRRLTKYLTTQHKVFSQLIVGCNVDKGRGEEVLV
jgi:hypothetical protein